jgi:hypothetical protein
MPKKREIEFVLNDKGVTFVSLISQMVTDIHIIIIKVNYGEPQD